MNPTVVAVPCFSGAPWELASLTPLAHRPLRTFRPPEGLDSMENYVEALAEQVLDLEEYVLVGVRGGGRAGTGRASPSRPASTGAVRWLRFRSRHHTGRPCSDRRSLD